MISLVVIACVALLPNLLGFGGHDSYTIAVGGPGLRAVAEAAVRGADALDAEVTIVAVATPTRRSRRHDPAQDNPTTSWSSILQAANARRPQRRRARPAGLDDRGAVGAVAAAAAGHDDRAGRRDAEGRGGFAFFAVLLLYGQLIGMGYFVATGVVEEKSRASSSSCSPP